MIPLCDLQQQYQNLKPEIDRAMQDVAASCRYILGPNVRALEQEVAERHGVAHAVGVGNGTDALHLAMRALGIGPGDEVITTPFTFVATTEAISIVGATPIFVDIDPDTFNMQVDQIEAQITERTRAILPVHLYGQPCEMDRIMDIARRHNLFVVEDCAQAIGATYKGRPVGTFGDIGCFSFFPSKNLGAMGDGGMVITSHQEWYERVEMLRRHGGRIKYHHSEIGINSRLDELQAAILRIKLKHLGDWNRQRRSHAYRYNALLQHVEGVTVPAELTANGPQRFCSLQAAAADATVECVYHQYTLQVPQRDAILRALQAAQIGCLVYYPIPLHLQEVHDDLGYGRGSLPVAEAVAQTCLSLPMFPELTVDQQDTVIETLRKSLKATDRVAA